MYGKCLKLSSINTYCHLFILSTDVPTCVIGEHLRQQVEDRLKFYETGENPAKNIDVMRQAVIEVRY